jgi:DNA-directed RNA polymerase subunit M/transcription elongation factor TFIIS
MKSEFHEKFSDIIKDKNNRTKIYDFIHNYTKEQIINENDYEDFMYYIFYELHVEWNIFPSLKEIFSTIKKKKFGYEHSNYDTIRREVKEEEDFIMNPPVVDEGVIQCNKCKSNRTISFNKQTRSGDEAVTVFVRCVDCGAQFRM